MEALKIPLTHPLNKPSSLVLAGLLTADCRKPQRPEPSEPSVFVAISGTEYISSQTHEMSCSVAPWDTC